MAVQRRSFLRGMGATAGAMLLSRVPALAAAPYVVGIGRSSDPYAATVDAIAQCGEWPSALINRRTVVIKTNLVLQQPAELGGTTHPEVVRALVDAALASGAAQVTILESARLGEGFRACGYEFFRAYDPGARVSLLDLSVGVPATPTRVINGSAYARVYLPDAALLPGAVFISAGKLKTHVETGATLSMKNLFGLPPIPPYYDAAQAEFRSRFHLHDRSVNQAIADLALARPIDFAVVDGVTAMEGDSPAEGTPVQMDTVIAGRNAVAVDRVGLAVMQIPQGAVQHLAYATWKGLGPSFLSQIDIRGPITSRPFLRPVIPPLVWLPLAYPAGFSPAVGQQTTVVYKLAEAAETSLEILRLRDQPISLELVRTLSGWAAQPAGTLAAVWDGRDDAGALVVPGTYGIRARSRRDANPDPRNLPGSAIGWVSVT